MMKLALAAAAAATTALFGVHTAGDTGGTSFTACMSSHGISGVTVDSAGRVHLASGNPFSDEYRKAVADCEHLLPTGTALPAAPSAPKIEITVPKAPQAPQLDR